MKNLFFITISAISFSLAPACVNAQDTAAITKSKKPTFIDNIEFTPQRVAVTAVNDESNSKSIVMPAKNTAKVKDGENNGSTSVAIAENNTPAKISIPKSSLSGMAEDAYLQSCTSIQFKYAILINSEVESIRDTALYVFVDNWIGTPYRYGGKTKGGIDCSFFAFKLLSDIFRLNIPRTAKEQYDASVRVHKNDLKEGDLVFFNTMGSRHGVSHVGVYLGNDYFVHSSTSSGVMISSLDEDYFSARFVSGGRLN
jgi:hypothetical protein